MEMGDVWVFLDVDGVLNCESTRDQTPEGFRGLDGDKLALLAGFVQEISAEVVLTSTWKDQDLWLRDRNPGADLVYLLNRLAAYDVEITAYAKDGDRGEAVRDFLEKHPGRAIIFDDHWKSSFKAAGVAKYLVQTSPILGLQEKHIRRARKLLARQEEDLAGGCTATMTG